MTVTVSPSGEPAHGDPPDDAYGDSFDAFYTRSFAQLVGYARVLGAQPDDAADAVQQAMLGALRSWDDNARLREMTAPRRDAYLRTSVRHAVIDQARQRGTGRGLLRRLTAHRRLDFVQWNECADDIPPVQAMLMNLPPQQRAVLLDAAEGFTTEETAQRLRISQSSVRTHLQLARKKLQDALRDERT